ncbi:MAG: tig [Proteobacteria bacterium]|jgi:trigger factor|nr:tig [Pseudomonadota bacterium]
MQTNQEDSTVASPLERRIDMAVPLADIDKDVEQRLKSLARTVKMAGFRPGKVPFKVVAQQYGSQARSEAIGAAVERAFGDAVRSQSLRVAGYPRIEPKQGGDQVRLEFSAVFEVYPEVTLGDISGRTIERPLLTVGDAEVEKTVEVLRKQRMTFVAEERAVQDGDRVIVDFTGRIGGEVFHGGHATDFAIVIGQGAMLPDFESQLKGMTAGDSKDFDLTFPQDYHAQELAGRTASFHVAVKRVEAPQLPALDADFARALGVADGNLDKMRSEVKTNLEREVKKRVGARLKEQVMNILIEANPIEVPRSLVNAESQQLALNARQDLQNRGIDAKHMPIDGSWFAEQATRRVKLGLIMAELVKEKGLQAKPEQVRAMVQDLAESYEDPAEVVRWYYSQPQQLGQAEALVVEDNVVAWVLQNARTVDKEISFDELMGTAA